MQHRKLLKGLNKVMLCSGCHIGDQVRGYCHSPEQVVKKKHVLNLPWRQPRFSARLALGGKREEPGMNAEVLAMKGGEWKRLAVMSLDVDVLVAMVLMLSRSWLSVVSQGGGGLWVSAWESST